MQHTEMSVELQKCEGEGKQLIKKRLLIKKSMEIQAT